MSKTLEKIQYDTIAEDIEEGGRLKRLLSKCIGALGLFTNSDEKIRSRIYLAYVFGWLVAVLKYGWRKMDLGNV